MRAKQQRHIAAGVKHRSHGVNGDTLIEGVIDLAFEEGKRWTLVDFKTDEEFRSAAPYQRQVGLYALAVEKACSAPVEAFLVKI